MVRESKKVLQSRAATVSGYVGVNLDNRNGKWVAKHTCKEGGGIPAGMFMSEWEAGRSVTKAAIWCPHCHDPLVDILLEEMGDSRVLAMDDRQKEELRQEGLLTTRAKGASGLPLETRVGMEDKTAQGSAEGKEGDKIDVIYMDKANTRKGTIRMVERVPFTRYWTQLQDDGTFI